MYEIKKLDKALENCQNLHGDLNNFLRYVQKLNIKYNYNEQKWVLLRNELKDVIKFDPEHLIIYRAPSNHDVQVRTSKELIYASMGINMKIIKIKRSLESMLNEIQRSIKRHSEIQYPMIYLSKNSDNKIIIRYVYN